MGLIKWHFVGLLPEPADWRFARNTVAVPFLGALVAAAVAATAGIQADLSLLESLRLSARALTLAFLGLLFPFVFGRLVATAILPRFERGLRTVLSLAIFVLLFLLNTMVTVASNPTSPLRPRALDGLFSHGPSLFQALTLLFEGALVCAALWRLARDPVTHHLRATRLLGALVLVILALLGDWWLTRARWAIAPENQSPEMRHELAIVVPHLDSNSLKVVLADARLTEWKDHVRFFADVVPGNGSTIGELVTFVTGMQPWEHGLRDNQPSIEDEAMLDEFLTNRVSDQGQTLFNRTLGDTVPVASFFDRNAPVPCQRTRANDVAIAAFSWMLPFYAQIPERLASQVVPSYSCSHALAPLSTLAEQALAEYAQVFNKAGRTRSLWLLNLPQTAGEDEFTRFRGLEDTLVRFMEILQTLGLDRNTRITLAGLGGGRGSIAVISDFDIPALHVTSPSALQVGTAQASAILRGVLPSRETLFYSEDVAPSPTPRSSWDLASAVFHSRRTIRCAWREASAQIVALLHMTPGRDGITTTSEELGGIEILSPVLASRDECTNVARRAFAELTSRDVSLLDPRPLEALVRKRLTDNAWALPRADVPAASVPAAPAATPGDNSK